MSAPSSSAGAAAASSSAQGPLALYRATGLGRAFVESVAEMYQENEFTQAQTSQALLVLDRYFTSHLADKSPVNKLSIDGHLTSYRYCDGVWQLYLANAAFHGPEGTIRTENIKVVACEAKVKGGKRSAPVGRPPASSSSS